jgi:hypothetical protein
MAAALERGKVPGREGSRKVRAEAPTANTFSHGHYYYPWHHATLTIVVAAL